MILIADSGSTKCSWALCNANGKIVTRHHTIGFNPYFIDKENTISSSEFSILLDEMINDYGYENFLNVQNILGSHDTERIASACVNPDRWIDHANNLQYNPEFKVHKPNVKERQLQKLLVAFQFMFPGSPYIYYGDEVGMWGADDPDCRKPMIWSNLSYSNEIYHPRGLKKPSDDVFVDEDLFQFYSNMISLRSSYPCLQTGEYKINLADDDKQLFVFTRSLGDQSITGVFNSSQSEQNIDIKELSYLKECSMLSTINTGAIYKLDAKSFQIWVCNGS